MRSPERAFTPGRSTTTALIRPSFRVGLGCYSRILQQEESARATFMPMLVTIFGEGAMKIFLAIQMRHGNYRGMTTRTTHRFLVSII
jgi:hypothetical protein